MFNLPVYIYIVFAIALIYGVFIFLKAASYNRTVIIILLSWMFMQSVVGISGFYTDTSTIPPKFALTIIPPLLLIIFMVTTNRGNKFTSSLNIRQLTILHAVRIPVEFGLLFLYQEKLVPAAMTFEGNNFDILSGVLSVVVFISVFIMKKGNRPLLIAYNLFGLIMLINIVTIAIIAAPFPFQQIAFDQPNTGVLYFPFNLLPAVIVPIVLYSHLASLRMLLAKRNHLMPVLVNDK